VIVNPGDVAADAASRGQWGCPGSTVMNALKELPIMEGGSTTSSDKSGQFKQQSNLPIQSPLFSSHLY
jgi:hypothetical protein